jgi:hypothetical protein
MQTYNPDTVPDTNCALGVGENGPLCGASAKLVEGVLGTPEAKKISGNAETYESLDSGTQKKLVESMKNTTDCKTQQCVVKKATSTGIITQVEGENEMLNLKTVGPAHTDALFSNVVIDNALQRITKRILRDTGHKHYHMNYQMIDFAGRTGVPPTELGKLNMVDIVKSGYGSFSVVMNTDERSGGGIHWFALFCDFRRVPYTVEYFNSSGNKPMRQIHDWIVKTHSQLEQEYGGSGQIKKVESIVLSGLVHQKSSETECGPYSVYYIWNRLQGVEPSKFQEKRITDERMLKFRKKLLVEDEK